MYIITQFNLLLILFIPWIVVSSSINENQRVNLNLKIKTPNGHHLGSDKCPMINNEYTDNTEQYTSQLLMNSISGDNILQNLRKLTKKPHQAGTENNHKVAKWIKEQWKTQGLHNVHFAEYDVLLSHPEDYDSPNTVDLLDVDGSLIYRSIGQSPPIILDEQSDYGANFTFNAYSASGTVSGNLIYVNYGTPADFEYLDRKNISLEGKIAMARYGAIWRGAKAMGAQQRGAVGVIIYSDPADVCPNITDEAGKYPHTIWMPDGGVQLGSLMNTDGDPLTPLYPSLDYTYRSKNISDLLEDNTIPSIPVQPISYTDAYPFLSRMKGQVAPERWSGGLNITYRIDQGDDSWKVRLTVKTNTTRGKIENVIGFIEGWREPDRYIIVGNHFDAWTYGAVDPNSATAVMLEMSRAFMQLANETGWKPLRTIVFCAWDAEEYGLIGSTEWAEQFSTLLDHRAVAYLNIDLIPGNDTLNVASTPTLYRVAVTAAKRVPNPNLDERKAGRKTVFDTWLLRQPPRTIPDIPYMPGPTGGSDHVTFFQYLGIPVMDFDYTNLTQHDSYPLYHTLYETPYLAEQLMDIRDFSVHVAVGQFWSEMIRLLADSDLLPLNVNDYSTMLQQYTANLNATLLKTNILPTFISVEGDLESLEDAISKMKQRAEKFHYVQKKGKKDVSYFTTEMSNSRLQQLERCFINPRGGNPDDPSKRHVVYGTGSENSYASSILPFIYAPIEEYVKAKSEIEKVNAIHELRKQMSILHYSVDCVTSLLKKTPSGGNLRK